MEPKIIDHETQQMSKLWDHKTWPDVFYNLVEAIGVILVIALICQAITGRIW